jgi:hypothetical protein
MVEGLMEDAVAHEAGRFAEIGRLLPTAREQLSHREPSWNTRLDRAAQFWRGWATARDTGWRADNGSAMATADWPRLARIIASDLALDRDTVDPGVVAHFAPNATDRVSSGLR